MFGNIVIETHSVKQCILRARIFVFMLDDSHMLEHVDEDSARESSCMWSSVDQPRRHYGGMVFLKENTRR